MINLVEIKNNQVVVSSRDVAENFGKQHKNVLRAIDDLVAQKFSHSKHVQRTGQRIPRSRLPLLLHEQGRVQPVSHGIHWKESSGMED